MQRALASVLIFALFISQASFGQQPSVQPALGNAQILGFRNTTDELLLEQRFLRVPEPYLAEQHLKTLTAAPHMAGTPEDRKTAEYVAQKFREAGLDTRIDEYKVWMNYPVEIRVTTTAPPNLRLHAPSKERVSRDPYQDDPRIGIPFNGSSPSGDVEAEVVYANFGRPEDFAKLKDLGIDVRGKIVLVRYGDNFRGVKAFVAEKAGAAAVIIYSDPIDDGYFRGDVYPKGPFRPETAVQRGSIEYMFEYPGDVTTPGIPSVASLPADKRTPPDKSQAMPKIPTTPISYGDARPILENLAGPETPREWQGGLPFTYHVGPGPVRIHMVLKMDYQYRSIWNVIGVARGSELPEEWVIAGNHRDAWVYGAVDPNSGTAAMLETVHGIGTLLKTGWKPKRTLVFASWDGEEEGLIGSTEYVEQYAKDLSKAVAYFNIDAGVSGPNFGASAVPSLKRFVRDVAKAVPSPKGGTVYDTWRASVDYARRTSPQNPDTGFSARKANSQDPKADVPVGDLGSGSDYTGFLQHLGVPSTDIASAGPYGVYHSSYDNFAWFKKFGDPTFVYEQEMARIMGIQMLRMSQADVLPFDYEQYGREIGAFFVNAQKRAQDAGLTEQVDFARAIRAAQRFEGAGRNLQSALQSVPQDPSNLNSALSKAERALLTDGLPNRPFFRHAIFAPGEYTGYAAVVIPGVNEAIDRKDIARLRDQLNAATGAVDRAAELLESVPLTR
jgi:N-acetylated-alpha-linked acidic dipeptidase